VAVYRRRNAAFTLVELLVVITILGLLMSLLLPAVNSVRESMRRTQCKNNLAQIGVAANAHVTSYGFFPSDGWGMMWLGDADRGTGAGQPGGWIYQLLPFMGLDMIHDIGKGLGKGLPNDGKYNAGPDMKSAAVPTFICPTRRQNKPYPDGSKLGAFNSAPSATLNKTDYAGNAGTNLPTAFPQRIAGDPNCMSSFPNCKWDSGATTGNGVLYQASQVTPGSITDGSSHTFLAGEKSLDPDNYYNSIDLGDDSSMLQGFDRNNVRWCTQVWIPVRDTRGVVTTINQFGSAHPAGVHFVYCDGSVRIIPYQINPTIYQNLGCRNDGNVSENY